MNRDAKNINRVYKSITVEEYDILADFFYWATEQLDYKELHLDDDGCILPNGEIELIIKKTMDLYLLEDDKSQTQIKQNEETLLSDWKKSVRL